MTSRGDTQVKVTFACFLYMHKEIRIENTVLYDVKASVFGQEERRAKVYRRTY